MKENNDDLIIDEELLNDLIINDIVNFQSVLLDNIDSNTINFMFISINN